MTAPLAFQWTGEEMRPVGRAATVCDQNFVVGMRYLMAEVQQRSAASHNHEFAWIAEAWRNLPEKIADDFPTPEHLRKRALIDAGFYDQTILDAGSNAAALRAASFIRAMDDFAVVIVRGPAVVRRTAKSQSRRAMDAKTFQASKTAVLETVAAMIGVAPGKLVQNAGMAT